MNNTYDLIIVGGGAAGMMAAISCKRQYPEYKVLILDRTFALGRKILVCGAGRCNITNINLSKEAKNRYYGARTDFVMSIINQFKYEDIVKFFNELGVELYVERKTSIGKLFPVTNQAKTITEMLTDEINRIGIDVHLNHEVTKVHKESEGFKLEVKDISDENNNPEIKFYNTEKLIISAGGKSYPALGSNGTGYNIAQDLGHSLIEPIPSALPLEGKNSLSHEIQGTKLEAEVTSIIQGKAIKTRTNDIMFTQYGVSGPAVLDVSREISVFLNREGGKEAELKINLLPGYDAHSAQEMLEQRWRKRPEQTVEKSLFGLFPNKVSSAILNVIHIQKDKLVSQLNDQEKSSISKTLTSYMVTITATRGWNEAEFTAGGINTKEVKPHSLESKVVPNLYFCGEILDVDGDVGGFNLSWAWSSGFVAGKLQNN
ncbi:NAD(P)/FAD-dependent oxidoreductase [Candidatus Dojkabacteria bacterium]|uniref:NAD(P)/FAD-dependent oxidoreductase n=1 Tax=Candidatus Dojkabacteria bacterium TaxID=2099670 RepID=A0A955RJA3_9BACT|nr:NAD(P)/FAD-dependent oxidoreductase [Candidatus Dojkabacteria bacterium]